MSLSALAIRLATIEALRGQTLAGDRVHDSDIRPVDLVVGAEQQPVILVTTDDSDTDVEGRDLLAADHKLELVVEMTVASKVDVEGSDESVIAIPATDAGLEITLNLLGWQIAATLSSGGGAWGDLWRTFVTRVRKVTSRRGADDANGIRYAARQLIFSVDHLAEPEKGIVPAEGDAWARMIAALKATPKFAGIGSAVEATIAADAPADWERVRNSLGVADDASDWIASKPFVDDADPLAAVDLSDGFTIDAQTAEDADGPEED